MKVLVLTSRFPYPIEKGDKLRAYYQIRELSQRHEVILVSLNEGPVLPEHIRQVQPFCRQIQIFPLGLPGIVWQSVLAFLRGQMPVQVAWFFRPDIRREIRKIIHFENPDLVFCQMIRMAAYAESCGSPAALDYMDCFSLNMANRAEGASGLVKAFFRQQARITARYEAAVFPWFQAHSMISARDREALSFAQKAAVAVAPNGVDTDFFQPQTDVAPAYDLVFVGNMGYYANVQAAEMIARQILPKVREAFPAARLLLAGARPPQSVQALAQIEGVGVSGWLPDIRDAYAKGKVFLAPLFSGTGQQNKILEAMAMGIPCVTTSRVNMAIGAVPGEQILIGDTPEALAAHVKTLLRDPALAAQLSAEARRFVIQEYSWHAAVAQLEKSWKSALYPSF